MGEFTIDRLLEEPEHFQRAGKFRSEILQIIVPAFKELGFTVHNESTPTPELDQAPEWVKERGYIELEHLIRSAMRAQEIGSVDSTYIGIFIEGNSTDQIKQAQNQINTLAKKHYAKVFHNFYLIYDYDEEDPNDPEKLPREVGQPRYSWSSRFGFYSKEEQ